MLDSFRSMQQFRAPRGWTDSHIEAPLLVTHNKMAAKCTGIMSRCFTKSSKALFQRMRQKMRYSRHGLGSGFAQQADSATQRSQEQADAVSRDGRHIQAGSLLSRNLVHVEPTIHAAHCR
ncbi:hypothetical protein BaRGS_00023176 [Batillaria attramentaria]|uniref:Uncharacterized protein n=1 Tax=Batillaria attramentaria TaxID=370345 RepID=A0ABD0KEZ5_9CAEN